MENVAGVLLEILFASRRRKIIKTENQLRIDMCSMYYFFETQSRIDNIHPYIHPMSQKSIPNFFDCNLKTNYQMLIIFGTNISDTTCRQTTA